MSLLNLFLYGLSFYLCLLGMILPLFFPSIYYWWIGFFMILQGIGIFFLLSPHPLGGEGEMLLYFVFSTFLWEAFAFFKFYSFTSKANHFEKLKD